MTEGWDVNTAVSRLAQLLQSQGSVTVRPTLDGIPIDLLVRQEREPKDMTLAIEVSRQRIFGEALAIYVRAKGTAIADRFPDEAVRFIFISNVAPDRDASEILSGSNVTPLQVKSISDLGEDLATRLFTAVGPPAPDERAQQLIKALQEVTPGSEDWATYQRLSSEIFSYLFCPPLETPKYENPDAEKGNRRDMVFPNSAQSGFWENVRRTYQAHYVVVDAKNYRFAIQKTAVIQLAHYLKPFGCGLFGILASRVPPARSAKLALRDVWLAGNKLVLPVDDQDINRMLVIRGQNDDPAQVLNDKITEFRLSL